MSSISIIQRCLCVLGVAVLATMAAAGCERAPRAAPARAPVQVIATAYPLADLARQVGGRSVRVDWVVESGQSLSGIHRTPELHARLRSAEIVLTGGETWSIEGFDNPYLARQFIRLDHLPSAQALKSSEQLWLHPEVAKQAAHALAKRLGQLQPENGSYFTGNAQAFTQQVDSLMQRFQLETGDDPPRVLVMGPHWDGLLAAVGIEPVAADDLSSTRLGDVQIRRLRQIAEAHGTRALVLDSNLPASVARDIGSRSGLEVIQLDGLGSSSATGRSTWLQIMEHNLGELQRVVEQ